MPPKLPVKGDPNSLQVNPSELAAGGSGDASKDDKDPKRKKKDPKDDKRRKELLLQSAKMESGLGQTEGDRNAFAPNTGVSPATRSYPLPCVVCGRDHYGPSCFE